LNFITELPIEYVTPRWYVATTQPRHEKKVAEQLACRGLTHYLPLYSTVHQWKDRRAKVQLPLFPGYIFVNIPYRERMRALQLPGILHFITFGDKPAPLSDEQIDALKRGLSTDRRVEPHPFLKAGQRVRVKSGPFQGLEGVLKQIKEEYRLVISIEQIMRSVMLEIDITEVEILNSVSKCK